MPRRVSLALIAVLAVLALAGWGLAINLAVRVLPEGPAAPDDRVTGAALAFARAHARAAADPALLAQMVVQDGVTAVPGVTTVAPGSPEAAVIAAEQAAAPAARTDLAWVSGTPRLLYRAGTEALVEVDYTLRADGADARQVDHVAVTLVEGRGWLVAAVWRIALDPGTPIAPAGAGATPDPVAETPSPEPTDAPLAVPAGLPPTLVPAGAVVTGAGTSEEGATIALQATGDWRAGALAADEEAALAALGVTPVRSAADGVVVLAFEGGRVAVGDGTLAVSWPAGS